MAQKESAWLRRMIDWCRRRLKAGPYMTTLNLYMAKGPTEPNGETITHSAHHPAHTKDYVQQAREIVDRATRHYSTEMMSEDWERGHSETDREAVIQEIATALASAPTAYLARPRCSTPSQEDTGSVSGTIETAPWCKDALFVLTTHGDGAATTLHRGWKAIRDAVVSVHYFEPDSDQRDEIMARFTDWEIWQNQGGFPWLWHSDYEDGAVTVQRVTEPPNAASGLGSTPNTESSPTQTIAPPGPTAGDVERAREICEPLLYQRPCTGDDIENPGLLLWRRDYDKLIGETAAALQAARAEARAELLAQIREWIESAQSDLAKVRDNYGDSYPVNELGKHIDALADKLTEAK